MTGVVIDDCAACGTMNARAGGESTDCRDCGADLVPRPVYECSGCGATMEGPPGEPPAFESPIRNNDCDICEFVVREKQ